VVASATPVLIALRAKYYTIASKYFPSITKVLVRAVFDIL